MGITPRIIISLLMILAMSGMYRLLNKRPARYYVTHWLDDKIPFKPLWVIPYIFYYPFLAVSFYLLIFSNYWPAFITSFFLGSLIAWVIWYIYPTGVTRPIIKELSTFFHKILRIIYAHDDDTNAIPSGHVLHTIICAIFLSLTHPQYILHISLLAGSICLSTVLVKQHYMWDVVSGILLAVITSVGVEKFLI